MNIPYLTGNEPPTAALMDSLFAGLDAKLTAMLGGRSPFLAQTSQMPQYLIGKAFFFTAGGAVYAPRVPGYIETNTSSNPVARPYNHQQFLTAQAAASVLKGTLTSVVVAVPGAGYANGQQLTLLGGNGTVATATVQTTNSSGGVLTASVSAAGSYLSAPTNPVPVTSVSGNGCKLTCVFSSPGYDVVNKMVPVQTVGSGAYAGLSQASDVGFFEWSLQAHYLMYQAPGVDASPKKYYIEDGLVTVPEKRYLLALAEIIIEGVATVTIQNTWDKYSCFRLHNLNPTPATVNFASATGQAYTVQLGPFQCATVRRDAVTATDGTVTYQNYRPGRNYFFIFEGGDVRFYWFFPTSGIWIGYGGRAANSMQANNLSNPAILLDWIQYFQRTPDLLTMFAGWNDDPTVQCDISGFYKNVLGDPSNPTTLLGDLLHHKGEILIVRCSTTQTDPFSGNPLITFDSVTFNGYATIVADFAAKHLTVKENTAGNLVITNSDAANNVYLCPISTNLLKVGDNIDGNWPNNKGIPLSVNGGSSVTIENAIFESTPEQPYLTSTTISATAPQLIQQPVATAVTPSKTWNDIYNGTTSPNYPFFTPNTVVVKGSPQTTLNWQTSAASQKTLNGIHKVTVAQLLQLDWWGDPAFGNQNSDYVVISNRKLTLTPQGLVLTFTETDSTLPSNNSGDTIWATGRRGIPINRSFRFRAHGFGFVGGQTDTESGIKAGIAYTIHVPPSAKSGMVSPNFGRFEVQGGYQGEFVAPNGADFTVSIQKKQDTIKLLTRVRVSTLNHVTRFWQASNIDNAASFVPQTNGAPAPEFFQVWLFNSDAAGYLAPGIAMGLIPEMYNNLARAVNSLTRAVPLQWQCLFFNVAGHVINLNPVFGFGPGAGLAGDAGYGNTSFWPGYNYGTAGQTGYGQGTLASPAPIPVEQFCAFDQGSVYHQLCKQLQIPVQTVDDFPGGSDELGDGADFDYFQRKFSAPAIYYDQVNISNSGSNVVPGNPDIAPPNPAGLDLASGILKSTISTELLSTRALLAGEATGSLCLGTYNPALTNYQSQPPPGVTPPPGGWPPLYPDFTNAPPGAYYVADDGSANVALAGGITNLFTVTTPGQAYYNSAILGVNQVMNLNGFTGYCWLRIEDVQSLVESFGFPFLWVEACQPVQLKYFEDPTAQSTIANITGVMPWTAYALGTLPPLGGNRLDPGPFNIRLIISPIDGVPVPVAEVMAAEIASLDALNQTWFAFNNSGLPGHGTLIKFCPTTSPGAAWKMPISGVPPVIANLSSSKAISPLVRYLAIDPQISLLSSVDEIWSVWQPAVGDGGGIGVFDGVPLGQKPSTITTYPQLAVQYNSGEIQDITSTLYNPGTLLDQLQVLAFNVYSTQPLALPVLLSPVASWRKVNDWWGNLDNTYAMTDGAESLAPGYVDNQANVAWMFVPAPPGLVQQVTGTGLSIIAAATDQMYYCCYSTGAFDLAAINF